MTRRIMLVGSPNCGKTLLFNRLTGLKQKVANFPGITIELAHGPMPAIPGVTLTDYPGSYSLRALSADETVAVEQFHAGLDSPEVSHVVCVIDVTRMEKSLYLTLQVIRHARRKGKHVIVVANMMDVLDSHNVVLDLEGLARELDAPVIPLSARTGRGIADLVARLSEDPPRQPAEPAPDIEINPDLLIQQQAHRLAGKYGPRGDMLVRSQNRMDSFFLHSWFGGLAFFAIMYLLFQSIFTGAAPAMDAVEAGLGAVAGWLVPLIGPGLVADFTSDAIFSGVGAFLVFVPQIFVLTLIVGLLEDSGYMARAALICHRPLRFFGLTGKSFIPMLSGVACAIPGVYAARAIDSPRRRRLTYMAIPLMPCSARLPVYALLIAAFIPQTTAMAGLVGMQGLAMFALYFFGLLFGLLVAGLASRRDAAADADVPFILEMPAYRMPALMPLIHKSAHRCMHFVTKAGGVILSVTVVVWILGYFPNGGADLGSFVAGGHRACHRAGVRAAGAGLALRCGHPHVVPGARGLRRHAGHDLRHRVRRAEHGAAGRANPFQRHGTRFGRGAAGVLLGRADVRFHLVILARETGSWKLPAKMFAVYGLAGYVGAIIVYQGISFLSA